MNEFISLMIPLILTIIIEYLVIQVFIEEKIVLREVVIVNVLTNPAINLFYKYLCGLNIYYENIYAIISFMEIIIFFIEGLMYVKLLRLKFSKAMLYSFLANLFAYIGSFVI